MGTVDTEMATILDKGIEEGIEPEMSSINHSIEETIFGILNILISPKSQDAVSRAVECIRGFLPKQKLTSDYDWERESDRERLVKRRGLIIPSIR